MLQKDSLLSLSDDEDSTQDESFTQNVSRKAVLKSLQAVQPNSDSQETQQTHPTLTRSEEPPLLVQEDLPAEEPPEVLDLSTDVLLHHGNQRNTQKIQLRLQRGQLGRLLSAQESSRSADCHDHSSAFLPHSFGFKSFHISLQGCEFRLL